MKIFRWIFTVIFFIVTIISSFDLGAKINSIMPILSVVSLFIASGLHGIAFYGIKNMLVFFVITWVVSLFFEALSIQSGFPFGHYFYDKLAGPRIYQVPIIIMFAYFSMIYVSWILSNILLRHYTQKLSGNKIMFIPLIATFIMVMWDLCLDPLSSTIGSLWVWQEGGPYYGVPLQNYFGWFLVVYIIFQLFAFYISKYGRFNSEQLKINSDKSFWLQASALYGIQSLFTLISPFTVAEHPDIYGPMALITVFTMIFVTLLSFITINESKINFFN